MKTFFLFGHLVFAFISGYQARYWFPTNNDVVTRSRDLELACLDGKIDTILHQVYNKPEHDCMEYRR